jgi:NADPH2:quinone reductase
MRAWLLDDFAGLNALRLADSHPRPAPAQGEVLVRVRYAALNPADRFLAENLYPARPRLPHILGRDGMGVVESVGEGVTAFTPGDRVALLRSEAGVSKPGAFAEFVVVAQELLAPAPSGWSDQQIAAAPLVYVTAYQALNQWGPLKDMTVLITGVSGGVGLATLQLARTYGHKVIGTTRGIAKRQRLTELGVELLLDPADDDFRAKVKEFTAKKGVDLVVDSIAGPLFNVVLDTLAYGGRISVVGMLAGFVPDFNTARLLFKRTRIGGVLVTDYAAEESQRVWKEIVRRLDAAGQRPIVDSVFPFEELRGAFDKLAAGPFGKVLLDVHT